MPQILKFSNFQFSAASETHFLKSIIKFGGASSTI